MAFILSAARLLAPSSELAIEERFYPRTALEDICGVAGEQVNKDRLYRAPTPTICCRTRRRSKRI